jgi:hypothetical protein
LRYGAFPDYKLFKWGLQDGGLEATPKKSRLMIDHQFINRAGGTTRVVVQ